MMTKTEIKEHPIPFTAPMVRAILEGRKTQTRRVVKPTVKGCRIGAYTSDSGEIELVNADADGDPVDGREFRCPYGKVGDRLWVKERCAIEHEVEGLPPHNDGRPFVQAENGEGWQQAHYQATDPTPTLECSHKAHEGQPCPSPWRPSFLMPRWASRITLEVTEVRVGSVQDIGTEEICSEGCDIQEIEAGRAMAEWKRLWQSINGKRVGYTWDDDPWVWIVEFKRIKERADGI